MILRCVLGFVLAVMLAAAPIRAGYVPAADGDIKVTLLGTGNPIPQPDRLGGRGRMSVSTLVQAGDEYLLFDAGRGVLNRLDTLGLNGNLLTGVFLTHLHSDHITDLDDIWLTNHIGIALGRPHRSLDVWGPEGTLGFAEGLRKAYEVDTNRGWGSIDLVAREVVDGAIVFDRGGVKVTAFRVIHRPLDAYGYRVEYAGKSVLLSGDTSYSENLVAQAGGVDLLLHEVALTSPELAASGSKLAGILTVHTSPEEVGEIFAKVKPKMAAYTHIVFIGGAWFDSEYPAPTEDDLLRRTRTTWDGPLTIGEDLMSFTISGDGVKVTAPPK